MATKKNLTALNKILQSGALKDALAFSQKYTPEDSVYKADQTRINDAISNLTRERFPEFEKARMSASGQFLANESKRNLVEGEQREAKRNFLGALGTAGRTKGGLRGLAKLLGKQSDIESKIGTEGRREQRQAAAAAQQEQKMVGDYNRGLSDQEKIYDFTKDRDIDALKSEKTRVQGLYGDTRARKMGDIMEMVSKLGTSSNDDKKQDSSSVGQETTDRLATYGPDNTELPDGATKAGGKTQAEIDAIKAEIIKKQNTAQSQQNTAQPQQNTAQPQQNTINQLAQLTNRSGSMPLNTSQPGGPLATSSAPTAQQAAATALTQPGAMQNAVQNIQNIQDPAKRAQMINQIRAARKLAFGQ